MAHHTTIIVRELVGAAPNYRNSAAELFDAIPCGMEMIVIDFTGVEFISRGFADQLHKESKRFMERCSSMLCMENVNPDVQRMMQIVALTQTERDSRKLNIPILRVKNSMELERALLIC
ncbi:MAG: hypothetical protein WAU08_02560 [Flavobacteriales bacterium]